MSEQPRATPFTIRDLLVGMAAIGLMCALIPSCNDARNYGPSRRTVCLNNEHQLSTALQSFDHNRGYFPGYANPLAGRTTSFVVPLMPLLERNDIYNLWLQSGGTTPPQQWLVYMAMLVCPLNPQPDTSKPYNSYVLNGGQADPPDDADAGRLKSGGIAFDHTALNPIRVGSDYVAAHDGTAQTIILSERLDAGDGAHR